MQQNANNIGLICLILKDLLAVQIVKKDQRVQHQNSPLCRAFEYPTDDNDINDAVIELKGRYPAEGRASNIECKEMS